MGGSTTVVDVAVKGCAVGGGTVRAGKDEGGIGRCGNEGGVAVRDVDDGGGTSTFVHVSYTRVAVEGGQR